MNPINNTTYRSKSIFKCALGRKSLPEDDIWVLRITGAVLQILLSVSVYTISSCLPLCLHHVLAAPPLPPAPPFQYVGKEGAAMLAPVIDEDLRSAR